VASWCRTLTTLMHGISPRVRNCITDGTMLPQFGFRNSRKWARDHFACFLARSMSMKVLVQDRLCCHTVAPRAVFSITSGHYKPPMRSAQSANTAEDTWVCMEALVEVLRYQLRAVTYEKNDLVQDTIHFWAIYASALLSVTVEMSNAAMSNALKIAPPSMLRGGVGGGSGISTLDRYR
jgi:hypothetical protein